MVASLCKQFSPPLLSFPDPSVSSEEHGDRTYHPFPHPSALAAPEVSSTLRSLGFGYRAEFIQKTAKMLVDANGYVVDPLDQSESSEKWLKTLRFVGTVEAREELLKLVGVGRKVADCVLLMSLDKVCMNSPFTIRTDRPMFTFAERSSPSRHSCLPDSNQTLWLVWAHRGQTDHDPKAL